MQEAHIELDDVKVKLLNRVQRGISAPEVIHPYLKACCMEPFHLLLKIVRILRCRRFGKLYAQQVMGYVEGIGALRNLARNVELAQVAQGDVNRNGNDWDAVALFGCHIGQRTVHHVHVQPLQQPRLFQVGNELGWAQLAIGGIDPACKRLLATHVSRCRAHDCLIERPNPTLCHGLVQAAQHMDVQTRIGPHLIGEPSDVRLPREPVQIACDLRAVEANLYDIVVGIACIDSNAHGQRSDALRLGEFLEYGTHPRLGLVRIAKRVEVVLRKAGAGTATKAMSQHVGKLAQERVALLPSVTRVVTLHAHDVERYCSKPIPPILACGNALARKLVKATHAGKTREPVRQSALSHLRHERICNEPPRARIHFQTVEIVYDHRLPRLGLHAIVKAARDDTRIPLVTQRLLHVFAIVFAHKAGKRPLRKAQKLFLGLALKEEHNKAVGI